MALLKDSYYVIPGHLSPKIKVLADLAFEAGVSPPILSLERAEKRQRDGETIIYIDLAGDGHLV